MAGVQPANENPSGLSSLAGRSNLMLRVVSSLVLAPVAIAAAYFGGIAFIAFWAIAALAVLWEWDTLVCAHDRNTVLATGAVALACAALLLAMDRSGIAISAHRARTFRGCGAGLQGARGVVRGGPGLCGSDPDRAGAVARATRISDLPRSCSCS